MSEDEDMVQQLDSLKRSKASLTEVLRQLDVTKTAFSQASRIEERQMAQQSEIEAIRSEMLEMLSLGIFKQKSDELQALLNKTIRQKFEEFAQKSYEDLSKKLSTSELEEYMRQKVNWQHFNTLSQQVSTIKTKVDKHIHSEFEGFKTKMKIELSHKANEAEDMHADLVNNEEIISLKTRLDTIEQQFREIARNGDEMLEDDDEDEDYDSEEELDNMNEDDLVRALMKNNKGDKPQAAGEMPALKVVKPAEAKTGEEGKTEETSQEETKTEEVKTEVKAEEAKTEAPKTEEVKAEAPKTEEPKTEAPKTETLKTEEPKTETLKTEEPRREEADEDRPRRKRDKDDQSETGSRAAQSRAGSRTSSMGGVGAVGGNAITQVNKKITQIKKELEEIHKEMEGIRELISDNAKEIDATNSNLEEVKNSVEEVNSNMEKMKMSFINALRRKGMDKKNKKKKPVVGGLSQQDIDKIQRRIDEKTKRILSVEAHIDQVVQDTNQLKSLQRDKMNEVIQSLHYLNDARNSLLKDFGVVKKSVKVMESRLNDSIGKMEDEVQKLQEPMTNIISDQQRENQVLTEDIRRHQGLFRNLVENYASVFDMQRSVPSHDRSQSFERALSVQKEIDSIQSPAPTLKHRLANNYSYSRDASLGNDMLGSGLLDKHGALVLPKVNRHTPQKAVTTIELSVPGRLKRP